MKNKDRKIIRDKYYYRFEALVQSPKFKKKIKKLLRLFEKFDCGIPKNGFKSWKEVEKWTEKLSKKHSQVLASKKYKEGLKKITKDKTKFSDEDYQRIEKWMKENTPPVAWMEFVKEILRDFGLDDTDEINKQVVRNYLLFRRFRDPRSLIRLKLTRNSRTNELELWLRILPYTLKRHIINNWDFIEEQREKLPGRKKRNKKRENWLRDLKIYMLYRDILAETKGNKIKAFELLQGEGSFKYSDKLSRIEKEYNQGIELNEEVLRKIISRIHRLLGDIDF